MRAILLLFSMLVVTGCSDGVTTRFETLAEARQQGAFERGWLPPLLPDTARAIIERNNLELNTGSGSFEYEVAERSAYIERLSRLGAVLRHDNAGEVLLLDTPTSRWEIRLDLRSGRGQWSIHHP
jgi:hypothetical protein